MGHANYILLQRKRSGHKAIWSAIRGNQNALKVDHTSFSCMGSLVTRARVTLYTRKSRARFEKQNNMALNERFLFFN